MPRNSKAGVNLDPKSPVPNSTRIMMHIPGSERASKLIPSPTNLQMWSPHTVVSLFTQKPNLHKGSGVRSVLLPNCSKPFKNSIHPPLWLNEKPCPLQWRSGSCPPTTHISTQPAPSPPQHTRRPDDAADPEREAREEQHLREQRRAARLRQS